LSNPEISAGRREGRFPILDALRIVLAMWVTLAHLGNFPLFAGVNPHAVLGRLLLNGWVTVVWAAPAVIGFFVISGFCIHLPFRHGEKLPVGRYYGRRYTRILVPVVVAVLISRVLGDHGRVFGEGSILWSSSLWSLLCEEVYYAIYPLARLVRFRFGWAALLTPAFLTGLFFSLRFPNVLNGTILGTLDNALVLFPVWLLGCLLAEQSDRIVPVESTTGIWSWRFRAWGASWIGEMLYFHAGVPYECVLLAYGVFAYFWIRQELIHGLRSKPYAPLVWAGLWSYSLYLIHAPAKAFIAKMHLPSLGYILDWFLLYALALSMAYLFYLCVERPSHRLARRIRLNPAVPREVAPELSPAESGASAMAVE
jgi:peptidoglycan/LPS O-acetylase OafA/YrhL